MKIKILQRYVLKQFFVAFGVCLFTAITLFLVLDLFDRSRVFIKEGSTISQTLLYLLFKIPLIIHLMMPIAVLISTLIAIGRLSQLSEVTAMRACGLSVFSLAKPLLGAGLLVTLCAFILGESLVPWATEEGEKLYHLDIRKKVEKGKFSRANFWYRNHNQFFNIGYYDSTNSNISNLSIFEFNNENRLVRRIDAKKVLWHGNAIGWIMKNVSEINFGNSNFEISNYPQLPLVIAEKPADFYNLQRKPETMSYFELGSYIRKLQEEGVPVTEYLVQQAAKISFPLVNVIGILIAFPFALSSARSGSLTLGFVAGITIGFCYHVVHAISVSLGGAELLPIIPAAWSANILLGCIGAYLMAAADY